MGILNHRTPLNTPCSIHQLRTNTLHTSTPTNTARRTSHPRTRPRSMITPTRRKTLRRSKILTAPFTAEIYFHDTSSC